MKNFYRIACPLLFSSVIISNITAQETADSLDTMLEDTVNIESNLDANLDSISNLWYVNQSVDTIESVSDIDTVIPEFSDEILMERLASLPSLVDLSYNTIVRRYIEMYLNKRSELVENMLGLAEYYFPIFDDIFDYYGLPNELKYLAVIESALNPRALSRARAVGIWQFMYGTGRIYGLTINSIVDERRDPVKSTHAAARYLRDMYARYGDWTLAIAAYNCGPGNVNKAIRRSGGKRNYWDLYFYLPRETRGYVPAFVAASYVMNFYGDHNLAPRKIDLPLKTDTIMLTHRLHLEQVSNVLNMPIKELRDMNPQYRVDVIPASLSAPYPLKLPEEYALKYIDMEDSIYAYKDSIYFNPDKLTATPTRYKNSDYFHEPPGDNMAKLYYTIKSGDNLGFISEWYHIRISDLKYWNNIRGNVIRSGQKLVIYVPKSKESKYSKINSMSFAEKQKMIGKDVSGSYTSASVSSKNIDDADFEYYIVKENDTLWDIARKYPGVSDTDIMRLNNISDASKIKPGQRLKIKPKG